MDDELNKILSDNKSGSAELALKINEYFRKNLAEHNDLIELIKTFRKRFSSYQIIISYLNKIESLLFQNDPAVLKSYLKGFEQEIKNSDYRIYLNAKNYLKDAEKIFTLSNSSTVTKVIKSLAAENHNLQIKIIESRPNYEGRITAKELLRNNIHVELFIDADMAKAVESSDAVLTGADKILKNQDVINKTGSRAAAIIAKHFKIPFYVLASKLKFSEDNNFDQVEHDSNEVWNYSSPNLKLHNYYFELIKKEFITSIITDD